jgi:hypothetical protein
MAYTVEQLKAMLEEVKVSDDPMKDKKVHALNVQIAREEAKQGEDE